MRAIVRGHKVRQNVPTGAAHELRKEGVAGEIKVPTSDDIWHLSIEDLLAPATEPARTAGQGPFVLNLRRPRPRSVRRRKDCCPSIDSMYTSSCAVTTVSRSFSSAWVSSNPSWKPTHSSRWCVSTIRCDQGAGPRRRQGRDRAC